MNSETVTPIDYQDLLKVMTQTRSWVGEAGQKMRGEARQQFDVLLNTIDDHFQEFKSVVPKAAETFQKKASDLQTQHEQNASKLADLEKQFEEVQKRMAQAKSAKPVLPQVPPAAPELGNALRNELLAKFAPVQQSEVLPLGEAWQDWQMNGTWNKAEQE